MAGKAMPWCKLYAEARTDKTLSVLTLAERGVWANLLCYASEQETRGTFNASNRYKLAVHCADGDEDVLNSTLEKLLKVEHLLPVAERDGYMMFRTFDERQAIKPSDRPEATRERKRVQRERHAEGTNGHAPSPDVTPQSRHVTRDMAKNANVTRLDVRERERDHDPRSVSDGKEESLSLRGAVAPTRLRAARPPDPLFDAVFAEFYEPSTPLTSSARGRLNNAVKQIRDAGGTPEEVPVRGAEYQARMPGIAYTPTALAAHWPTLGHVGLRPALNGRAPPLTAAAKSGTVEPPTLPIRLKPLSPFAKPAELT